jgi:hypothetical protein
MRNNLIRIVITVIGAFALWRLWGTPHTIYWWGILVLIVLSWVTAKIIKSAAMVISILCLMLAIAGIVLSYTATPPKTKQLTSRPATSEDRENCRKAFVFFLNANSIQWDADGNKFELTEQEMEQLKAYIKGGLANAEMVSDSFLVKIHPLLPEEFRERLVAGWSLYLEGLEKDNEAIQENGMILLMQWEDFKVDNVDLLYNTIIKTPEEPQPSGSEK